MDQGICLIIGQVSFSSLYWKKNPPNGYMLSEERLTRKQLTSRPHHLWPELWTKLGRNAKLEEKQKWSHEKLHLDNARKLRGIYFIDRNLRIPSSMLARNWKHQWLPLCLARLVRTIRIVGMVHPVKSNQNLRVFWKLVNLQDCVWENHCQLIMKTILQEKETIHCSITS